uniref:DUF1115 domain-containing protein n=1 Tax=Panagrellus redivivus TaxID=6233 RepID=A0A7E5A183_PANRE
MLYVPRAQRTPRRQKIAFAYNLARHVFLEGECLVTYIGGEDDSVLDDASMECHGIKNMPDNDSLLDLWTAMPGNGRPSQVTRVTSIGAWAAPDNDNGANDSLRKRNFGGTSWEPNV